MLYTKNHARGSGGHPASWRTPGTAGASDPAAALAAGERPGATIDGV